MGKLIGYARVSTRVQDTDRQSLTYSAPASAAMTCTSTTASAVLTHGGPNSTQPSTHYTQATP